MLTVDKCQESDGQEGHLRDKIRRLRLPGDSWVSNFHKPVQPLDVRVRGNS